MKGGSSFDICTIRIIIVIVVIICYWSYLSGDAGHLFCS